jgi:hypothetical protein
MAVLTFFEILRETLAYSINHLGGPRTSTILWYDLFEFFRFGDFELIFITASCQRKMLKNDPKIKFSLVLAVGVLIPE